MTDCLVERVFGGGDVEAREISSCLQEWGETRNSCGVRGRVY